MKRATRNAVKTKKEIIEKSAPIFNVNGFSGTSIQMLVEATGFQKGGIYRHFETKMDLARAVFKYNVQLLRDTYAKESSKAKSPKEQLLAIVSGYKSFIINPPMAGGCPILNMAIEADDMDETNRLLVKEALNEWKGEIEEVLKKGIKSGDFQEDLDITQVAFFIIATIEGSIMVGQIKRSVRLMASIADGLQEYMVSRIFKRPSNT